MPPISYSALRPKSRMNMYALGVMLLCAFAFQGGHQPSLYAEPVPDAGTLIQEQQFKTKPAPQQPTIQKEERVAHPIVEGPRVLVKSFVFKGYEGLVKECELYDLVSSDIGNRLSLADLQAITLKITAYLKSKGWTLARAYLPAQDITDGTIEIHVLHGKLSGNARFIYDKSEKRIRIREKILQGIIGHSVRANMPLNQRELESSLLLINDLPGVKASSLIVPGSEPGFVSLDVDVAEGPLVSGAFWGDNMASRYSGSWRGNLMLTLNDPMRIGDQLNLMMVGAEGLAQGRLSYSFPLSSNGLRGSLGYTGMNYEVGKELADLEYKGFGHTADAGVSYPLLRSRKSNINTGITYGYGLLVDKQAGQRIRDKSLNTGTLAFNGNIYDSFLGGGYTSWFANLTAGDFDESIADVSIIGSEGWFTRYNFGLMRQQQLMHRFAAVFGWSMQLAPGNLDSSQKIYLGGPGAVRAYPVGEGGGDCGHLFNFDMNYAIPAPSNWGDFALVGFYDAGQVTMNADRYSGDVQTATGKNSYWLIGCGVGISYSYQNKYVLRSYWAHTIGDNPGRSSAGMNADGKDDDSRYWLQAMMYF